MPHLRVICCWLVFTDSDSQRHTLASQGVNDIVNFLLMIQTICISSSMRFKTDIQKALRDFQTLGIKALFPNLEVVETPSDIAEQKRLFAEHFAAIDDADALYVINKGGYIGSSVKIEIGYTLGKGKIVIFAEQALESELNALAKAIISLEHLAHLNEDLESSLV